MKIVIDRNVILDAMVSRAPFHASAEKLFLLAAEDKISACITATSVTDIYYLLHKHLQENTKCRQALLKLFALFKILDIISSDCKKALELPMTDYEDALLATCAKREKANWIVTRNLKDFSASPVRALSPDDFLKSIS